MEFTTFSEVLTVRSCSPTCACTGGLLRWLLDRVCLATPIPLLPPICMAISSTYTCVTGSVSIHNVHTVAPCYGELLALLVIPTPLRCPPPSLQSPSPLPPSPSLSLPSPSAARSHRLSSPTIVVVWSHCCHSLASHCPPLSLPLLVDCRDYPTLQNSRDPPAGGG
jgi:hypothetical protein